MSQINVGGRSWNYLCGCYLNGIYSLDLGHTSNTKGPVKNHEKCFHLKTASSAWYPFDSMVMLLAND